MQAYIRPFQVVEESSQTLAVTGTSQPLTLPAAQGNRAIRIAVSGTVTIFWKYDSAAAVATSTPMLAGTVETFLLPRDVATINFIASGVGSTVFITIGQGT